MNANDEENNRSKHNHDPKHTTRNNIDTETKKTTLSKSTTDTNGNTTTVAIIRITEEAVMGGRPLAREETGLKEINMQLQKAGDITGSKQSSSTTLFTKKILVGEKGITAQKSMRVPA